MKKLFALLLALTMVFSFVACEDEKKDPCVDHKDTDGNLLCDACGEAMPSSPCSHKDANVDGECDDCGEEIAIDVKNAATLLSNAVSAQLEATQSLKVVFEISNDISEVYWEDEASTALAEWNQTIKYELEIVKTADGGADAKVKATMTASNGEESYEEVMSALMIGDFIYTYDSESDTYFRSERYTEENMEMNRELYQLLEGVTLEKEELDEITLAFSEAFVESFNFKAGKGSLSIDAKTYYDEVKSFFDSIDKEKDTVADVIDKLLAKKNPELKINDLIDAISDACDLTVLEAYDAIDAWLVENYETTLQKLYADLVSDENFKATLMTYFESLELPEEELAIYREEIGKLKDIILRDSLASYVTEAGLADASLYDILAPVISELMAGADEEGEEYVEEDAATLPTKNALFGAIKDLLALTVGEFDEQVAPLFTAIDDAFAANVLEKASLDVNVSFTDDFALSAIEIVGGVKLTQKFPSYMVEGKMDQSTVSYDVKISVSGLSPIGLPLNPPDSFVTE